MLFSKFKISLHLKFEKFLDHSEKKILSDYNLPFPKKDFINFFEEFMENALDENLFFYNTNIENFIPISLSLRN